MTRILILSVDRMLAQRIENAMGGRVPVELVQALDSAMLEEPGVVVVDRSAIPPERSLASAIAAVAEMARGRPIVLASDEAGSDHILAAVRAGVHDFIARNAEGDEVSGVLSRLLNMAMTEQGSNGQLTVLIGADPEAAALLATDLALVRAAGRPSSLLIDCALPTSAAAAYLDLDVSYGMASAIADAERLDANLLASALARHGQTGLQLLTFDGGTGAEPAGVQPGDIASLVRLLRACSSDIVLNAGSLRHSGLLRELCAAADRVELVATQSIRELEALRRTLDKINPDAPMLGRMRLLIWDHRPGILLDGKRMVEALGIGESLPVPVDPVRMRNALNAGQPLALQADSGTYLQAVRKASGIFALPPTGARAQIEKLRRSMKRAMDRRA